jgi:hypothetical protein
VLQTIRLYLATTGQRPELWSWIWFKDRCLVSILRYRNDDPTTHALSRDVLVAYRIRSSQLSGPGLGSDEHESKRGVVAFAVRTELSSFRHDESGFSYYSSSTVLFFNSSLCIRNVYIYFLRIEIFVVIDFFHNCNHSSYSKNYASIIYLTYPFTHLR